MRALIQRVDHASVTVEGSCVGKIEKGIPYDVCNLDEQGLIHYLETYLETV